MTTEIPTTIQAWRTTKSVLCDGFKALMAEEAKILHQAGPIDRCYAYVAYRDSGEFEGWVLGVATESLEEQFALLSTEAGIALGTPPGTLPLTYWLHCLFLYLRANTSKHISLYSEAAGFIERLFEASAIYCTWLDRRSLEIAAMSPKESCFERKQKSAVATVESIHERSERRCAVVMPILKSKGWKRGTWATRAGIGKNGVYEYLNGTRNLCRENRQALAEELGLKPQDLPD